MNANTFDEIIKSSESLTLDQQLRLATILIEKFRNQTVTFHPSWQHLHQLISSMTVEKTNQPSINHWRTFFESSQRPTEDFMSERVDLPPQIREIF